MASKRKRYSNNWRPDFGKKRRFVLVAGLKGIMCTCNGAEKQCIKESYNLLNEYADELYGPQCSTVHGCGDDDDDDDELNAEIASLKKEIEKPVELRRFQVIESGVKNRLFIQTTIPDPVKLVNRILKGEKIADGCRTRSLIRIIPVEATCKAYMKDIETAAAELFDRYFTDEGKTFCIIFHRHNNDSVDRSNVIDELAEMIKFRHPGNKVDLKHPQLTVLVEIMRSVCCLSVLPDYMELHKYNMVTLCSGLKNDQVLSSDELPRDVDKSVTVDASSKDDSGVPVDVDISETGDDPSKDDSRVAVDVDKSVTVDASSKDDSGVPVDVDINETGDDPSFQ